MIESDGIVSTIKKRPRSLFIPEIKRVVEVISKIINKITPKLNRLLNKTTPPLLLKENSY
jgi:hypothetical protein